MRTLSESRASGKGTVSSAHFSAEFLNVFLAQRKAKPIPDYSSQSLTILGPAREGPWVAGTEKGAIPSR